MPLKPPNTSLRAELRAIKWFTLTHAAGLLVFALLMGGFFWGLHAVEEDRQGQVLHRDLERAQQSIRLRLRENQVAVMAASHDWALPEGNASPDARAREFLGRHPEIAYLAFVDSERQVKWLVIARGSPGVVMRAPGTRIDDSAGLGTYLESRNERRPSYSSPFLGDDNELLVELYTPMLRNGAFSGSVVVAYALSRILTAGLSAQVRERYHVSLTDQSGNVLVSASPRRIQQANLSDELPLDPPGRGVRLRAFVIDSRQRLLERGLLLAVIGLTLASTVSLILLWRHGRRRLYAEAEHDRLFRLSGDLMCVLDDGGHFTRVNPAFRVLFGASAESRTLPSLAHPQDIETVGQALLRASAREAGAANFEARFENGDAWRWLAWSLRGDPEGMNRALYGVAHDVTERKAAENALAAETSFRQSMEDSVLTGMRAFDMQGRIVYVNRAFCEMTGYTSEALVGGMAPYPYWPPDDYAAQNVNLEIVLGGNAPSAGFEVKIHRRDNSAFDARMYVSPLVGRDARQTGWMSSITDITEPKRIRGDLAAAQERFTTVLDELDAAVWVLPAGDDAQSVATRAEPAADGEPATAIARAPTDPLFANRAFRSLFRDHPLAAQALADDTFDGTDGLPFELHQAALGRWLEVRSRSIRWVDGRQARMLMASDVTRRHQAEERQREQDEKLGQTARLVTMGEMASSLAHELNQPLTAIANYCMGLSARIRTRHDRGLQPDIAETLEMLGKTAAQAERAGMVIRRIRDFVKRSEPERRSCEVSVIVGEAMGLAEIEAQRRGVRLEVDVPEGLPTLLADPILIQQVLLNLVRNGLEALDSARHCRLQIRVTRHLEWLEFTVIDTGTGLAPGALEKLFQPFFTTKKEGMGMGLNICRTIIESHKGRLWVETDPGDGCAFHFTLPIPGSDELARAA